MLVGLNTTWTQPQATARWYHGVSPRIIISRGTRVRTGAARPLSAASCGCPLSYTRGHTSYGFILYPRRAGRAMTGRAPRRAPVRYQAWWRRGWDC